MMSYKTISAILRGRWLIDRSYAESQLPIIVSMLKNHSASFQYKAFDNEQESEKAEEERRRAVQIATVANRGVYKVGYYTKLENVPDGSIAFVDLVGPIMKYGGFCSYGSMDYAQILSKIDKAGNFDGVILNVDSPGGQVDGTTLLADRVKSMSKPVVAMVDDGLMASAAMWIGSAADEIYATKASDTFGSIGVYATLYDWNAYMKSEGLPVHEIYAPQSEQKNKDFRDALAGDYSGMKSDLGYIADTFIKTIETNRPKAATSKDKWSKGGMFYAKEATDMGLIDGVKSFSQIIERVSSLASNYKKSNKNKMSAGAFQHTISASQAEGFAVVENGFLLTEENLNNIESHIVGLETAAAEAGTNADNAQTALQAANDQNAQLTADLATANSRIAELEAQVEKMNPLTLAPVNTNKAADSFSDNPEDKYLTSYDLEKRAQLARIK
jgi:ClpP class serine protease